jgi:hypothetical protein
MKINSLIPNTAQPAYNGKAVAGVFHFKQVFEFLILGTVKVFR